ncbi:MAG: DUF3108 domain-containing protein [Pyrinomonadaceae bacterium]|nr:DUF3108 domain-containing protein [Pyrinomonadaceae bacterium]
MQTNLTHRSIWNCLDTALRVAVVAVIFFVFSTAITAQSAGSAVQGKFRIGEKLSYSVSFEKFQNAAYLETYVASAGKLGGKNVVELRGRLKTFELVSAAFSTIDENRTVFVDPDTGIPLMIRRTISSIAVPKETVEDFLTTPTTGNDLLSLIYRIRESGGNGSFSLIENGETHIVTVQAGKPESVKTDAGVFETTIVSVRSSFFDAMGFKSVTVNLSNDENKLPVLIRFRGPKGDYRAELTGIQIDETPAPPNPTVTPTPVQTPKPAQTPKPQPTATPYIESQPLLPELAFALGETREYRVTSAGQPIATVRFEARERKQFQGKDSLKLVATVTAIEQGNRAFALGDSITSQVDPETLAPYQVEIKFGGALKTFNQTANIDPRTGSILFAGTNAVDAPVGTHSLLSLIYAMRSFNLDASKNPGNPVNDTRVAVFWTDRPYIFTLRPGNAEMITIGGEKVAAQQIVVNTGNPQLDQLAIKVWLADAPGRVPLRFSIGAYQADIVTLSKN